MLNKKILGLMVLMLLLMVTSVAGYSVTTEPVLTEYDGIMVSCADSDDGMDIDEKGQLTYVYDGKTYILEDRCTYKDSNGDVFVGDHGDHVTEGYCVDGYIKMGLNAKCDNGESCSYGACVSDKEYIEENYPELTVQKVFCAVDKYSNPTSLTDLSSDYACVSVEGSCDKLNSDGLYKEVYETFESSTECAEYEDFVEIDQKFKSLKNPYYWKEKAVEFMQSAWFLPLLLLLVFSIIPQTRSIMKTLIKSPWFWAFLVFVGIPLIIGYFIFFKIPWDFMAIWRWF